MPVRRAAVGARRGPADPSGRFQTVDPAPQPVRVTVTARVGAGRRAGHSGPRDRARAPLLVRVTGTVAPPGDDVWQLRRHGTVARLCRRAALSPARGGPGAVPSHRRRNVQVCGLGSADRQRLPARRRRSRHCPAENLRFDPGPTSESCSVTVMPPPRRAGPGPGLARSGSRSRRPAGPRRRRGGVGDINIGQPRPPLRPAGLP